MTSLGGAVSMISWMAGTRTPHPLKAMIAQVKRADHLSAASQPGPAKMAMEMPMKAPAEVMASER